MQLLTTHQCPHCPPANSLQVLKFFHVMSYNMKYNLESIWRYSFFFHMQSCFIPFQLRNKGVVVLLSDFVSIPSFHKVGRKQLQKHHNCKARPSYTAHLKELSPVGMPGSGLTASPKEHTNRKTGKQMEPWDREREECKAGELSKLVWFFSKPREVFYWKDCSLQQASELSGALKPPHVRGSGSTASPLRNNGVGRILLI